MKFADKITVVTGAASGIGRATAEAFAAEGATVCVADIARESGEAVAAALRERGAKAAFHHVDMTDAASIKAFADAVLARYGRVDILVNAAGWGKTMPFVESDDAFWEKVISLNFVGPMRLTRALLPQMLERTAVTLSQETERRALTLTSLLEPLLILLMGAVVLVIVLAVLLPIIEINQLVR